MHRISKTTVVLECSFIFACEFLEFEFVNLVKRLQSHIASVINGKIIKIISLQFQDMLIVAIANMQQKEEFYNFKGFMTFNN